MKRPVTPFDASSAKSFIVVRQLMREMWLPFLLAVAWTLYSLYGDPFSRTLKGVVTAFGPSFFLMCWGFAQWHRVKKQQRVESSLDEIVARLEQTISDFNERANRILSNVTGGNGFCYLLPINNPGHDYHKKVLVVADDNYSLFELSATVIDWDVLSVHGQRDRWTKKLGELLPGAAHVRDIELGLHSGKSRNLKIDFYARNGRWRQNLLIHPLDSGFAYATRVERDGVIIFEQIGHQYPVEANGLVDWKEDLR